MISIKFTFHYLFVVCGVCICTCACLGTCIGSCAHMYVDILMESRRDNTCFITFHMCVCGCEEEWVGGGSPKWLDWLASELWASSCFHDTPTSLLELLTHTIISSSYKASKNPNSGLHSSLASTSPHEPSLQPEDHYLRQRLIFCLFERKRLYLQVLHCPETNV